MFSGHSETAGRPLDTLSLSHFHRLHFIVADLLDVLHIVFLLSLSVFPGLTPTTR